MSQDQSSSTPLVEKLGFKPGDSVYVDQTPDWYSQFAETNQLDLTPNLPASHAHIFCTTKQDLTDFLADNNLKQVQHSLWCCWVKQKAGVKADVGEQFIRTTMLRHGWVDSKVASIDETWSGLKFTRRR